MIPRRKDLLRGYKDSPPPMGVWMVRNTAEDKVLLGASPNAAGRLNRERFTLELGSHPSRGLQADWNRLGETAFDFRVLDTLDASDAPDADSRRDLAELLALWIDKLALPPGRRYQPRG